MARIPAATKAQLLDLCPLSSMEKTDVDGESELEEAPTFPGWLCFLIMDAIHSTICGALLRHLDSYVIDSGALSSERASKGERERERVSSEQ
eukprot:s3530_g10.t1